ncbi:5-(carboxyamino)imidazole ribonucleotide synthase [Macrococcus caseolyticus]|uniref:5-(carboxyamino)imidazole ribonucleotide synthase n=1 Tax=Macrococcoides caseolyticum TaxID=69966 RepID=UPI0024BC7C63|nr:5-(carboxyamino)imidazole ribonucleotide synthase [Macrococcus caseolyticus]MDJ1109167.1 5-(carboxyamino)imidazole ribonucleotide synthase [Macrococcus caseolyticus]
MTLNKFALGDTIGIIGGGQLGKMMAQSAQRMGFKVAVLDPDERCPARFVAHHFVHAPYNDIAGLKALSRYSDVITYEFENINAEALEVIAKENHVPQGFETVNILQNRLSEKEAIARSGATVVPYRRIESPADVDAAVREIGLPLVLKTVFGGYDGKGQLVVTEKAQLEEAYNMADGNVLVAEKRIALDREISITASRNLQGEVVYFPVQENVHRNQILFSTTVKQAHDYRAAAIAEVEKIIHKIHFVGTFTVEFFIDKEGKLYVNEIAPRPHNSGHYSIEACDYSQFDTHILSVLGYRLPKQIKLHSSAVMYNLLGQDLDLMEHLFPEHPEWHVHVYGKEARKENRKMGHITLLLDDDMDTYYPIYKELMK